MRGRLLFDPSAFFPTARRGPSAASAFAAGLLQQIAATARLATPNPRARGGAPVKPRSPRPTFHGGATGKPVRSPTKTRKPLEAASRAVRQRKTEPATAEIPKFGEAVSPGPAFQLTGCGRRPDGTFG